MGLRHSLRPFELRSAWRFALLGALSSVAACGGSGKSAESVHLLSEDELRADGGDLPAEQIAAPITELQRARVNETVDAGLGRFLQQIELEPSVVEGRFQGFRIVRFVNPEDWRGTGLSPGDVVTRVNDQPIEKPDEAYAVFASLKTATNLDVTYSRSGKTLRLSLPIVGQAPKPAPEPSASPVAAPASAPAAAPPEKAADSKSKPKK